MSGFGPPQGQPYGQQQGFQQQGFQQQGFQQQGFQQGGRPTSGFSPPQGGGYQQPTSGFAPPQQYQQSQAPPGFGPPQDLRNWFNMVDRDRSGKINPEELRECMGKTGYQFSVEACKMMINMHDRDGNGQISYDEFVALHTYIGQMQDAFRQVDSDRSGRLEPAEVQRCLQISGYTLSPHTFNVLMNKFDRRRQGGLGFDGYIELCVFIGTARNIFASRDTQRQGRATFMFDEFIGLSASMLT